ncbi:MAG: MerR family transcriptional regulator [Chloroflexota bacterium]
MFKIGEFSRISRVPAKTLRYYDEIGLFSPQSVDKFTGYRYYSAEQLPRLNRILALKDLNLSLAEIGKLLSEDLSAKALHDMFRIKEAELSQEIQDAQARLQRVTKRIAQIEQEGHMPRYDIVVKTLTHQRVVSIRQIAPKPEDVGNFLGEAAMAIYSAGITLTGQPYTIFYDPELKDTNMDIETVIPVAKDVDIEIELAGGRKLIAHTIDGIDKVATIVHKGSYDNFESPYAALGQWIEENNYQICGAPREVYLQAPSESEEPITEIQYPISKA